MFDDYSLRLLGEIGIDVYRLRGDADAAPPTATAAAPSVAPMANSAFAVAIVHSESARTVLLRHVGLALRAARVQAGEVAIESIEMQAATRGLIVFGDTLARTLGAQLSAQRQAGIEWVIASEPDALARSAPAKRALWGEIKRLARALDATPRGNDIG